MVNDGSIEAEESLGRLSLTFLTGVYFSTKFSVKEGAFFLPLFNSLKAPIVGEEGG